jgi:hypothetical protein
VSMEYAGTVEVEPPFRGGALDWVRGTGWMPTGDGRRIRPRSDNLDDAVRALREMVALDDGQRSYAGVVAAYDTESRNLVLVHVRDGRVTRRATRRPEVREGSNVIDLATHRRTISRQIG